MQVIGWDPVKMYHSMFMKLVYEEWLKITAKLKQKHPLVP